MAETPASLTTSIRQKLRAGKSREDIIQELVAGGLTQSSAERFADRAGTEAPADTLDEFLHASPAASEAESGKTGFKQLLAAGLLMSTGVIVTGVSYIMADAGERYIAMWGPIIVGGIAWVQAVFSGRKDGSGFAWRTAIATLALPLVLSGAAFAVAAVTEESEESILQKQMDRIFDPTRAPQEPQPPITISEPQLSAEPDVAEMLAIYDNTRAASIRCEMARRLSFVGADEKAEAVSNLVPRFGLASDEVKVCIARAVQKLDRKAAQGLKPPQ